jgi:hypothetical protein
MSTRRARRNALTAAVGAIAFTGCSPDRPKEAAIRLKIIVASALTAIVVGIAAPGAGAADPIDKGNCLSSFVNGGAHGRQVSGDPGGAQASGELGQFLRETRGRC